MWSISECKRDISQVEKNRVSQSIYSMANYSLLVAGICTWVVVIVGTGRAKRRESPERMREREGEGDRLKEKKGMI